jgi:hypothetical protein
LAALCTNHFALCSQGTELSKICFKDVVLIGEMTAGGTLEKKEDSK